jgi:hypothetical protein
MATRKKSKAILFEFAATMNDKGHIELNMDSVNPDDYVRVMEQGVPEYDATFKVASLIRYLKSMGDEMIDKSSRYL